MSYSQPQSRFFRFFCRASLGAAGALLLSSCHSTPTPVAGETPARINVIDTIMVPGADDKLHPHKVSRLVLDTQMKSGGNPAPALEEIIKMAPQWFPKGTHVEDVKDNAGIVTLLMSNEFGDAKHWQKGETTTELAVYSLVNTLAKDGKKVALTLEGKPIPSLGELATADALEADPTLNAQPAATDKTDSAANKTAAGDAANSAAMPENSVAGNSAP